MKRRNHVLIAATVFGALLVASTIGALAADQEQTQSGLKLNRRTPDDKKQIAPNEMLSDLRDLRLSLGQVKQQSVNLF